MLAGLRVLPQKNNGRSSSWLVGAAGSSGWPVLGRLSGYTCPSLWRVVAGRSAGRSWGEAQQGPNRGPMGGRTIGCEARPKKSRAAGNAALSPRGAQVNVISTRRLQDAHQPGRIRVSRPLDPLCCVRLQRNWTLQDDRKRVKTGMAENVSMCDVMRPWGSSAKWMDAGMALLRRAVCLDFLRWWLGWAELHAAWPSETRKAQRLSLSTPHIDKVERLGEVDVRGRSPKSLGCSAHLLPAARACWWSRSPIPHRAKPSQPRAAP